MILQYYVESNYLKLHGEVKYLSTLPSVGRYLTDIAVTLKCCSEGSVWVYLDD